MTTSQILEIKNALSPIEKALHPEFSHYSTFSIGEETFYRVYWHSEDSPTRVWLVTTLNREQYLLVENARIYGLTQG